jgi:hypothetical protein
MELPQLLAYPLRNIIKTVKRIRMAARVTRMRSSKASYAVKHGQYVVAVKHVLEGFSSSINIAFKYSRISSSISICKLACKLICKTYHTNIACQFSPGTGFVVSRTNATQSSRNCPTKFSYTCDHKLVFLFHFRFFASYVIRKIPEMLSYRLIKLCSRLVLRKT